MGWFAIAAVAYFLMALENILHKFLLTSKKISHPATYAFYSGVLSLFALALFPFGFHLVNLAQAILAASAGIIFIYGILCLFFAIKEGEASQVVPTIGAITPLATYFFSIFLLRERPGELQLIGVFVLILGGLLISLNFENSRQGKFFVGFYPSILSGVLLALAYTLFKNLFEQDGFVNVYIWTRFGLILGALSLFFVLSWRKAILKSLTNFKKPSGEHARSGLLFTLNKTIGGIGSFLLSRALSLGDVTIVNALVAIEYAFIFFLAVIFYQWWPKIFRERNDFRIIIQKTLAILVITAGIVLVIKK